MDWLPLFEYSAKYGISVSTLRRKIRQKSLVFRLDQGKYLVADQPVPVEQSSQRRDLNFVETPRKRDFSSPSLSKVETMRPDFSAQSSHQFVETESKPTRATLPPAQESSTTLALVEEIKRAYALILQEKEEQICLLKEEISDLRTLVRVLETENSRKR